jgi:competence protein ComEA
MNNSVDVQEELIKDGIETKIVVNEPKYYQVDIKGAINKPGVYKVEENLRVIDVINLAGGLTKLADTSFINLSKKVTDEMVIVIYTTKEIANYSKTIQQRANVIEKLKSDNRKNDAIISEPTKDSTNNSMPNQKININLATLDQLTTLPGIGDTKANAIIAYRNKNSGFKSIEEIKEVSGIGNSTFDQIKNLITV